MYNPSGTDTDHEWVEIYNNDSETYNLTGWKIRTGSTDHTLNVPPTNGGQGSMLLSAGGYVVIVQNATAFLGDNANYTGAVIDSSWSDLSNTANSTVVLKNSTAVFDNITYSPTTAEGNTICILSGWQECAATPGAANKAVSTNVTSNSTVNSTANSTAVNVTDLRLSVYVNSPQVNSTYSLFLIEIDNKTCSSLDNVTVAYNITPSTSGSLTAEVGCSSYAGSWTPQSSGDYTICGTAAALNETNTTNNVVCKTVNVTNPATNTTSQSPSGCNISASIMADSVYNSSQAIEYKIILNDTVCSQENTFDIEYWIEDLFGGYVKDKTNTTQSMVCSKSVSRQWTPSAITGSEAYRIIVNASPACDTDKSDNLAEKLIIVRGSQSSQLLTSNQSLTSQNNASTQPKFDAEITSYPENIFVDDDFEIAVKISNPSAKKSLSVYSYVYSGSNPVSQGFNGTSWKSSWDANKKEIDLEANGTAVVKLVSRIENGTAPGFYNLKAKIKGDEDLEVKKVINVTGNKPGLEIKASNGSAFISTECEDCEIMVVGSDMDKTFRKSYALENVSGVFKVFLLRNSKIMSRYSLNISKSARSENRTLPITGFAVKKPNNDMMKYVTFIRILSKMKLFNLFP